MAHERATRTLKPGADRAGGVLAGSGCSTPTATSSRSPTGTSSTTSARQPGTLGTIFRKAQNRIQDPAKLKRLIVDLIDKENWSADRRRHQGRRLRGAAVKGRRGHQVRRRAVLHPPAADPGDGRLRPADAVATPSSTRPAAPAASCSRRTSTPHATPRTSTPTERDHLRDGFVHGVRARRRHRPPGRDEPAAARHRHAQRRVA